jgi:FtsH-binding integral membrane protein
LLQSAKRVLLEEQTKGKDFTMRNNSIHNNRGQSFDQTQTLDNEFYAPTDLFAAAAAADERAGFITKTYVYLLGAIAALVGIEVVLFTMVGGAEKMMVLVQPMIGGQLSWLIVLGGFMLVSWVANMWAMNSTSSAMQHAGLALYVGAMSILLLPLLCLAQLHGGSGTILSAATTTAGLFAMLTLTVFITRKDFSFLRSFLTFGGFAATGLIVTAILFDFALGPIFMYAMIAFFCCYILYYTSNILHHYRIGQHCAAALALFASVVMLFWYILQLFLSREE